MFKLDKKDRRLIKELDFNARASLTYLGKCTGLKKNSVAYRLKKLEESVISGYYTLIDLTRLGNIYVRAWMKYSNISPKEEENLIDYLLKSNKFGFVVSITGRYNLGISLNVESLEEFSNRIDLLLERYGRFFKEMQISIASRLYSLENAYAYHDIRRNNQIETIGRERSTQKFDNIDRNLLKIISGNARISLTDLGKRLDISLASCLNRIRRLEKDRIILAYRPIINYEKLGYQYYKLFLVTQGMNATKFNQLLNFANSKREIIYLIKAIEHAQIEIEVVARTPREFINIVNEIRTNFNDNVREYYYNQMNKEYQSLFYI